MPFPVELLRFFERATGTGSDTAAAVDTPSEPPNGHRAALDAAAIAAMAAAERDPEPAGA
jgi:hypothetical protein